jgi:S1-C subfamily serine protease
MSGNPTPADTEFNWTDGVVAIVSRDYKRVGTGFVVSDEGLILTCSHVLEVAGWPYMNWEAPVNVRFKATGRTGVAVVKESCFLSQVDGDVAILALESPLPEGVQVLPMLAASGSSGHDVLMWGYPQQGQKGLSGSGKALPMVPGDHGELINIDSDNTTHGFSGSPVWDVAWKRVIGMFNSGLNPSADDPHRLLHVNFATPAEALVEVCPDSLSLSPLDAGGAVDLQGFDSRPLLKEVKRVLSSGDLEDLAFELKIEYDDLPGSTKSAKARELILFCERRDMVRELLAALTEARGDQVDWYAVSGAKRV